MTHTTLKCTATQLTSQASPKRPADYLYTLRILSLTCTSNKKVLVFIITFFAILRAAWLLHPSQVEKYPSVHNNYYATSTPTPTPSNSLSSTMPVTSRKEIKDTSSVDSLASKQTNKQNATNKKKAPSLLLFQVPRK